MKLSIRNKILFCALIPVCLLGGIVIFIASTSVKNSIISQVEKSLQGTAVATLAAYDQNSGSYIEAENGDIWKGSYNISQSEKLVDTIHEKSGMEVTFFYGSRRIMTSAIDKNNERILGSPAGDTVAEHVLVNGEAYFSDQVVIDGVLYYGYYVPVYQNGDKTTPIGMVFAGARKNETLSDALGIIALLILIVFITVIVCAAAAGVIAATIANALRKSVANVQEVASGRLDVVFDRRHAARKDEIGDLTRAIERLQKELRHMIGGISNSTDMLIQASDDLKQTSHETVENMNVVKSAVDAITKDANSQAENTKNASENIQHMGNLIIETGKEVSALSESSDSMRHSSDRARDTISELKNISKEVIDAVDMIAEQTQQTNESAKSIKEASDFISEIAEETSLLSLNAGIEAARAGEAGKGFSVVASQIQKLAEQSNNASGSIDETVNTLIHNSGLVVQAMTRMQEVIEKQKEHIGSTEKTVGEVTNEIEVSIQNIRSIEERTKELEHARMEMIRTIAMLSDIADNNASGTQETNGIIAEVSERFRSVEESASNLRGTADLLAQNIGSFRL